MSAPDLPEAAGRRLAARSWSSSLSVADLAALGPLRLRPVGLVQGFCVMSWNRGTGGAGALGGWYAGGPVQTYQCPHPWGTHEAGEDPNGYTWDLEVLSRAWGDGYGSALRRMLEEADALGAEGVVAVTDSSRPLLGEGVQEFHLLGTAVVHEGTDGGLPAARAARVAGRPPWSTFLAGAKLAKLFEAGLAPVSVVGALCELALRPGCATDMQERGTWDSWRRVDPAGEVVQLSDAHTEVRRRVREQVRRTLEPGWSLHGADLRVGEGHHRVTAVLRGTAVRQVHDAEPLPAPVPVVHLR